MSKVTPDFLPRKISRYVPAMEFAAEIDENETYYVDLGAPVTLDVDGILAAQSIATATSTTTLAAAFATAFSDGQMGPFGRALSVVASGAATSTVTVKGRDYWGQPMLETMTLNGNTPVNGLKAFFYIDEVSWGATAATTINLGWRNCFGLPYKSIVMISEIKNKAVAANAGTLTAPVTTDPATATTGDPRGTYTPATVIPDGTNTFELILKADDTTVSGNGGYHGIAHYYA